MDMQLTDLQTTAGLAVLVTILVQVGKRYIAEERVPLFALGLGVVLAVLATAALGNYGVQAVAQAILTGLLGGAAAIGLYEVAPRGLLPTKE